MGTCVLCGDEREIVGRGLCRRHYKQMRTAGRLDEFEAHYGRGRVIAPWRNVERKCACGQSFEPTFARQSTCSTACAVEARKKPQAERRTGREIPCAACGKPVYRSPSRIKSAAYCSFECALQRQRTPRSPEGAARVQAAMKQRNGKANPNWRSGKRAGVRDREGERRWYAALGRECSHPSCPGRCGVLVLHHIVYRQAVRRAGGDEWDPRNALTLGNGCHSSHHRRGSRIVPLASLPDSAFVFAVDTLAAGAAYEYLRRRYSGEDARLDSLLAASSSGE